MTAVTRWEQPALTATGRDVVDGWAVQLAGVAKLAEYIAATEFVPKAYRDQPAAVAAAILAGREMGIGPMTALQHLYVVEGRPAMSAQLMRALVMAAGHTFRVVESTSARCTVVGRRRGETVDREPVTWSGDEVRRAGLAGRGQWQKYPRQMLLARATAELCRAVFPDVLGGMAYAVEEAADMPDGEPGEDAPQIPTTTRTVRRKPAAAPDAARQVTSPVSTVEAAVAPLPADPSPGPGGPHLPPLPDGSGPPPLNGPESSPGGPLPDEDAPAGPGTPPAVDGPADSDAAPHHTESQGGDATADDGSDEVTGRQRGHIFALLTELGVMQPRARRLNVVSALVGRNLESMGQLTHAEATPLIDVLIRVKESADPAAELEWLVANGTTRLVLGGRDVDQVEGQAALLPDTIEATPP